jgi:hypothetical protein
LILLIIFVFSPAFARFYTDYLWFKSMDLVQIFTTRLRASILLVGAAILTATLFLIVNWSLLPHWLAPKARLTGSPPFASRSRSGKKQPTIDISTRPLRLIFTLGAVIAGIVLGLTFSGLWRTYLLSVNGATFDLQDPIFNRNIGFYVFNLPWYRMLLSRVQVLVALALLGVLARYLLFGQIKSKGVTAHLSLLGTFWLVLMALERFISRFGLLQSELGVVSGAGYTDIHARLPLFTIEAVLFLIAALILIVNLFTRQWKLLVGIGIFWIGLSLLAPLFPAIVQQFTVEPNEFIMERPYIEHNIRYTRYAYDLAEIEEQDYAASGTLKLEDLDEHEDVLNNVRLWDYRPLKRTYSQLQEIRLYYTFDNVDIDRYRLDGDLTQVMLAARELNVDELAEQAQTWVNRHLIFTHGYGLTLNSVNQVTPDGLPRLLVRDIPPISEVPELAITRPQIYFGEQTEQYALVNAAEDEFDYPQGDVNAYNRYSGPDGVLLGNTIRRMLLATRFNSVQILLSSALSNDSRILFHRTIHDRAGTIAPMLWLDDDPYPVIVDGRIIWLLDAYTWTEHFPYSESVGNLNYIRNSVKITVDAYTGEIHFYLIDPQDPIAATYARIFPGLFEDVSAMPEALRAHWRYPETLFLYQSQLYATYHMRDPQVFYNREDLWDVPQELVETRQQAMEPYYATMRLPNSEQAEFMLIRPYVPRQKENMVAWLYARCDGENYGELGVFKLTKERLVYGPLQIEGRIDQNPQISQQLSLWDQLGSRVLRGNLLVIPINDTFLYVEPLYLEAESAQLPELKRVIVAYADQVAMAPTLQEALVQVFSGTSAPPPVTEGPVGDETLEELAQRAWEAYQAAESCLTTGDWACYGREQATLENVLRQMAGEE